jgi:hypothetical protein
VLVAFSSAATLSIRQRCEKRIKPKIKMAGEHGLGWAKNKADFALYRSKARYASVRQTLCVLFALID